MCPSVTYNGANWTSIQTSQTTNGTCILNFLGSPTRNCIQNGTIGVWNVNVTNPCSRNLYFTFFFFLAIVFLIFLTFFKILSNKTNKNSNNVSKCYLQWCRLVNYSN